MVNWEFYQRNYKKLWPAALVLIGLGVVGDRYLLPHESQYRSSEHPIIESVYLKVKDGQVHALMEDSHGNNQVAIGKPDAMLTNENPVLLRNNQRLTEERSRKLENELLQDRMNLPPKSG